MRKLEYPLAAAIAGLAMAGLLWLLAPLQPPAVYPAPPTATDPASDGDEVVVVAVGDVMLGNAARRSINRHGFEYPFEQVAPLIAGADLLTGNLEAPITRSDVELRPGRKWTYRQSLAVPRALHDTGFDVLVLANNHTMDYTAVGLADTIEALEGVGIEPLGAGPDEESAREGLVVEIGGLRVGMLAYQQPRMDYDRHGYFARGERPGVARLDRVSIADDIQRLRAEADVVLVQCHFGRNYRGVLPSQERLARGIVDLGADAVIGHHSHTAQGVEVYRGVPILYSLGNFTFGTKGRFEEDQQGYGLVARLAVGAGGVRRVELDLIGTNNRIVKYQPTVIGEDEAREVLEELVAPYDTDLVWQGSTAVVDLAAR